jgi:hypothetical protein
MIRGSDPFEKHFLFPDSMNAVATHAEECNT